MTYPDPSTGSGQAGEVITTTYNAAGWPQALASSLRESYVVEASYTPEGRVDLLRLGGGCGGCGRAPPIRRGT